MRKRVKSRSPLKKMSDRGFRGYPVATIAFYGPDNQRASKVAVGIVLSDDADPVALERWFSEESDVRSDPTIGTEIVEFIKLHKTNSVALTDRIIGCPHEEGKDYPDGDTCPQCPFWAGRDRFTHEPIHG